MVGLSIVLEFQKGGITSKTPQVINKTTMSMLNIHNKPSSSSSSYSVSQIPTFIDQCFLCRNRLSPAKDIYMYKGDKAFCSVECRCKQIFMDEEESIQKENCSLAAMRPTSSTSSSAFPNASHHLHQKPPRNPPRGSFAH